MPAHWGTTCSAAANKKPSSCHSLGMISRGAREELLSLKGLSETLTAGVNLIPGPAGIQRSRAAGKPFPLQGPWLAQG